MSTTSHSINAADDAAGYGNWVNQGEHSQENVSPEQPDQFDEEFFFPDVIDVIAEGNQISRFEIEYSDVDDVDDIVDAIDLNRHDLFYDTNT